MIEPSEFPWRAGFESIYSGLYLSLLGGAIIDWLGFFSPLCEVALALVFMKVAEIYSDRSLCLVERSTAVERPVPLPSLVEFAHARFNLPSPVVSGGFIALHVSSGFIFWDC